DVREMAILATAVVLDQPYEIAHHRTAALRAGVTPAKVDAIIADEAGGLEPLERAVVAYAVQVSRARTVEDATFEELRSYFSDGEMADLVLTVAWYHLCAAVLGPLEVELEVDDGHAG
ncbi:MAG TPA: carboxymuconolactone decarboxylase family protein, partial [Candidatus Acidoferrum sp.]|nr:carboxymuconolactone decarboxylase family protein [Candidatus Acidoferrum sp.]